MSFSFVTALRDRGAGVNAGSRSQLPGERAFEEEVNRNILLECYVLGEKEKMFV